MPRPRSIRLAVLALALLPPSAPGQDASLRLQGLLPAGPRTTLTDSWGALQFSVTNAGPDGRDARVVVVLPGRREVRYGRDVWVPARATLSTWLPVGPAPPTGPPGSQEVEALLFDRAGGADRLVLPPGEERVRSRLVRHRPRVPTTVVLVDVPADPADPDSPTRPTSRAAQAIGLVNAFRKAASLPEAAVVSPDGPLPPAPEAFDGVDHLVLAGNRLAADPSGAAAVREWVRRGGRLWVMLDLVDPDAIAPLLRAGPPVPVVDRVGLTTVRPHKVGAEPPAAGRDFERPVDLVRVIPSEEDTVLTAANGWPTAFARPAGRGRILFTTLGAAGWFGNPPAVGGRPPKGPAPPPAQPGAPVPLPAVEALAYDLHPRRPPAAFTTDDLRPLLTDAIGYSVVGRPTAGWLLGGFVVVLAGLGVGLRWTRRPELAGLLGAAAAVGAAGLFLVLAHHSRQTAPPTVGTVAVADVSPDGQDVVLTGLVATYQPTSGSLPLRTDRGTLLDLDPEGLEGQVRTRVQTDTDAWHWDGLDLPAGVRTGQFAANWRGGPVTAVARFGPGGVEGDLSAAGFGNPADAVIHTPAGDPLAVRFVGSAFAAGPADALRPGEYVAGGVLTDRQQRRQAVYRQLLAGPRPQHLEGRELLLAWADVAEPPVAAWEGARHVGSALLVVPLRFERPAAGTRVSVPAAFVACRRVVEGGLTQPTLESTYPARMRLRFQLPASVRPLAVDGATLNLRIRAPSRRVAVAGEADGVPVPLAEADSPSEPIRLAIADPRLLRPDPAGGILLDLAVTNLGAERLDTPWKIEAIGLDVTGTTAGGGQ